MCFNEEESKTNGSLLKQLFLNRKHGDCKIPAAAQCYDSVETAFTENGAQIFGFSASEEYAAIICITAHMGITWIGARGGGK